MATRTFRLSDDLDARLAAEAERQERSASWLIVKALERALGGVGDAQAGRDATGHDGARVPSLTPPAPTRAPKEDWGTGGHFGSSQARLNADKERATRARGRQ